MTQVNANFSGQTYKTTSKAQFSGVREQVGARLIQHELVTPDLGVLLSRLIAKTLAPILKQPTVQKALDFPYPGTHLHAVLNQLRAAFHI